MPKIIIILALFFSVACAHLKINKSASPQPEPKAFKKYKIHGFVLGFVEGRGLPEGALDCESKGWSQIDIHMQPIDILLSTVSFGFYFPQTVQVTCKNF